MSSVVETVSEGLAHHRAGRLREAEKAYRRALEQNPRHAPAMHLLGLIAVQVGKHDVALNCIDDAIRLDAFHAPYHADRGQVLQTLGRGGEAAAAFQKAIELNSEDAESQLALGNLLLEQDELAGALVHLQKSVRLNPDSLQATFQLGAALQRSNKPSEAQACFEQAVRLAPQSPTNYFRLGAALHEQGKLIEAIACYHKSLQLQPGAEGPTFQIALARLQRGEFDAGWPDYDAWQRMRYTGHRPALPLWRGEPLDGRRIWVHGYCALGDVLQFVRYLPMLAERGGEVYLDVQPRLIPILEDAEIKILVPWPAQPDCQVQTHLFSLPYLLGTRVDTIPAPVPYLNPRPELVARWQKRLAATGGHRVGINWQGNPNFVYDRSRSIPLEHFAALAAVPGVTLVSLQKEHGLEQLAQWSAPQKIVDLSEELDTGDASFLDTAAVMANLDLVVTSDTAIAHLAGALGVPVWIALSEGADWRWLEKRDNSPWYPTARLFRQSEVGQWEPVFAQMAAALAR